jgi:hypothetical protein
MQASQVTIGKRWGGGTGAVLLLLCLVSVALTGCDGVNTPGRMEWVHPQTEAPHVGTVYLIRGWQGVFSSGIDAMAKQLRDRGITAYVYMPEQYPELAATMVERYKGQAHPEPICFIGHSRGVDSSLIISRELDKAGVPVQLIVCLDSVDETTLPKNVSVCYNYWMEGFLPGTNFLRGIPLQQAPGSRGQLYNINLHHDAPQFKESMTNHVNMDKGPKLQAQIIKHVLEACPERSIWLSQLPKSPGAG